MSVYFCGIKLTLKSKKTYEKIKYFSCFAVVVDLPFRM